METKKQIERIKERTKEEDFFKQSHVPYLNRDYKKASYLCRKALSINFSYRPAYLRLGNISTAMNEYDKAFGYYRQYIYYSKESKDKEGLLRGYNLLGNLHSKNNNLEEALKYYNLSLYLAKKYKRGEAVSNSYNNMALAYRKRKAYKKGVYYYKQALKNTFKGPKKELHLAYYYFNMAILYKEKESYFVANIYLRKFKKLERELKRQNIDLKEGIGLS